jgi:hypothetical protein
VLPSLADAGLRLGIAVQALTRADTCRLFSTGALARFRADAWQVRPTPPDVVCAALARRSGPARGSAQAESPTCARTCAASPQRVGELSLRVEQLEHENAELKAKVAAATGPATM